MSTGVTNEEEPLESVMRAAIPSPPSTGYSFLLRSSARLALSRRFLLPGARGLRFCPFVSDGYSLFLRFPSCLSLSCRFSVPSALEPRLRPSLSTGFTLFVLFCVPVYLWPTAFFATRRTPRSRPSLSTGYSFFLVSPLCFARAYGVLLPRGSYGW